MTDTIFALSSGSPPAAIAVIRISGPEAFAALRMLAGDVPPERTTSLRLLRDAGGQPLDRALVLAFAGPRSSTGEDVVELHTHGGRAVIAAVLAALANSDGLRTAEPGEFTRRALTNGVIDVAQAEGLADLLEAESEDARVAALSAAEGAVGRQLRAWQRELSELRALTEAAIDYDDDAEVMTVGLADVLGRAAALHREMQLCVAAPTAERLRDGALVVLAGPPNAGKSSLFNALIEREAAIVTPIAGTTRDAIEAHVQHAGRAYRLVDTAGLAATTDDLIERIGIDRARALMTSADLLLWLGDAAPPPGAHTLHIFARFDEAGHAEAPLGRTATSINDRRTIAALWTQIAVATADTHGVERRLVLRERQVAAVEEALHDLSVVSGSHDHLLVAESLRRSSNAVAAALGESATESMLDALFSRFCLGK